MIQNMLKLNPNERFSIESILAHPWMKGEIPNKEEVVEKFKLR